MPDISIALIHPPVAKPSEPPAGTALLAGALKAHGVRFKAIDANVRGLNDLLRSLPMPQDTWGRRAHRHLADHLAALGSAETYTHLDRYRRAVADINRLLSMAGKERDITVSLADYNDKHHSPVRSKDLVAAAKEPEKNPFFGYFQKHLLPELTAFSPDVAAISINYLSQALCAFALIGLIRQALPVIKVIIGGGLVTSWLQHRKEKFEFGSLVDQMVAGPGERMLLQIAGIRSEYRSFLPDYDPFAEEAYLSPGRVLPFSASQGCWWRRCAFCPERAEQQRFRPLPHSLAVKQLQTLTRHIRPTVIHLLDNALSPALVKTLAAHPPGAPWYGFVRFGAPLDDPEFCRQLAASGCLMLKLGLESGDQKVLDALEKGIRLETASKVLNTLHAARIATYVYVLFGTPSEDESAACKTMQFVVDHKEVIDYLNIAIFNLPMHSPEAGHLELMDFYQGDMALYKDFKHPKGWSRNKVRRFVEKEFRRHPAIRPIVLRDPPIFTSNHAAFFTHPIHMAGHRIPRITRGG